MGRPLVGLFGFAVGSVLHEVSHVMDRHIGSAVSRASGVAEEELGALQKYADSDLFSELDKLVLDLAVAMTATPAEVTDELRDALLRHLTPGQSAELAATIAWENHRARLNRALGVRAAGFSDGAFCAVPEYS